MNDSNPYASPKEAPTLAGVEPATNTRMSLLHHAARFSCYAPFLLMLISPVSTWSPLLWGLFLLIYLLAFISGIVAIIGGIRHGVAEVVRLAVLGALLSGFPLAVLVWCICQ